MSLHAMERIAKEATREALSKYPSPSEEEQATWTLGKFETESEGIFEIYVPSEQPLNARVISRARIDRKTGKAQVEVFLARRLG